MPTVHASARASNRSNAQGSRVSSASRGSLVAFEDDDLQQEAVGSYPPQEANISAKRLLREDTFADAEASYENDRAGAEDSLAARLKASNGRNSSIKGGVPLRQWATTSTGDVETGQDARVRALYENASEQKTYLIIHLAHNDVKRTIDAHLTWEELTSVDLNYALVRPLAVKYAKMKSLAVVYCFLFNKIQFLREGAADLAFQQVNQTRAMLCELLALKLVRTFSADGLELVTAMTAPFSPFVGIEESPAYQEELRKQQEAEAAGKGKNSIKSTLRDMANASGFSLARDSDAGKGNLREGRDVAQTSCSALEIALFSSSKKFVKSPLVQKVVQGIWDGTITISQPSSSAILNDNYKKKPLTIYDPKTAPFLDHYRLRVPKIRSMLEFGNFMLLLFFFVLCLGQKESPTWTKWETMFAIWLGGFALDEMAQAREHGFNVYLSSVWNLIDSLFVLIAGLWFTLRVAALRTGDAALSSTSFDVLALGSVLICPRVASALVRDNVVLLALRAMLADFTFFMSLACVCFSGFFYAFYTLSDHAEWPPGRIAWLLLKIWFGNTYLGFDAAQSFSEIFGPPLIVLYAVVSNTLLLTVLVSLLSNTFSTVAANADEEVMYHHTSQTLAGVSTDALFSYVPPLNLVCLSIIWPASFILTPRWLHKLNVALIRTTSFPILLAIHLSERLYAGGGLELTAERAGHALSLLPLGSSGKSGLDVVEAVFVREDGADDSSWEATAMEKIKAVNDGGDREAPNRLSRNIMEASVPDSDGPQTPNDGKGNQETSRDGNRRKGSDGGYIRGFGHSSSPLAKMFSSRQREVASENDRSDQKETRDHDISTLISKIETLERQNERLETLLLGLSERLPSQAQK